MDLDWDPSIPAAPLSSSSPSSSSSPIPSLSSSSLVARASSSDPTEMDLSQPDPMDIDRSATATPTSHNQQLHFLKKGPGSDSSCSISSMTSTLISTLDVGPHSDQDNDHTLLLPMTFAMSPSSNCSSRRSSSTPLHHQQQQQRQQQTGDSAQEEGVDQEEQDEGVKVLLGRSVPIPSEVVLHVFRFLSAPQDVRAAVLVSKQWCLCGMELLWSRPAMANMSVVERICNTLTVGGAQEDEPQEPQEPQEPHGQELEPELALDKTTTATATTMAMTTTVFPYHDYVRRLNFSFLGQELTDASLVRFTGCLRLERLLLPGCTSTTEEGLKAILSVGRSLYSLDLSGVSAVTDSVLEHIAVHCPKLHTLYLAGCTALTDASLIKLATSCTSLKRIKLNRCALLTDASILALTKNCRHIMEIDVTSCNLLTNNAIQSVFQSLHQIRDLNLTLVNLVTDVAFTDSIPALTSSLAMASHSSSLTMSLSSSTSTLVSFMPKRFEQLRVLNLTSCVLITDETLARILPAAPRLRNLTLTKCDRITDQSAHSIKVLGKHLHYLHLGHCSKLTDRAIATLSQHCTRIRYLDLACCSKLTDAAVFAMAQLPKLRRIGLVKCSNITDHGIYAMLISQVVPQTLERVHLSYCVHLSDTAVSTLVQQCTKLTHLSVTGVPAFMSPRYQKFCRLAPSEFTAHQREVFCVFSGKGVRELRQFMKENPAMSSSTLSNIQRCYRIMGSTVASMVAGGEHSSTILSNLGFELQETGTASNTTATMQPTTGSNATTEAMSSNLSDLEVPLPTGAESTSALTHVPDQYEQELHSAQVHQQQLNYIGGSLSSFILDDTLLLQWQQQLLSEQAHREQHPHHHQPLVRIGPSAWRAAAVVNGAASSSSTSSTLVGFPPCLHPHLAVGLFGSSAAGSSSGGSGHTSPANDGQDDETLHTSTDAMTAASVTGDANDMEASNDMDADDEDVFGEHEGEDDVEDDLDLETRPSGRSHRHHPRQDRRRLTTTTTTTTAEQASSSSSSSGSSSRNTRRRI